jgi:hypothetical protein
MGPFALSLNLAPPGIEKGKAGLGSMKPSVTSYPLFLTIPVVNLPETLCAIKKIISRDASMHPFGVKTLKGEQDRKQY